MTNSTVYLDSELHTNETYRHWAPQSQAYAPADILLQYLATGWEIDNPAAVETYYCAGVRRADVYLFSLRRAGDHVEMPVLANPAVSRLIEKYQLTVHRVNVDCGETH